MPDDIASFALVGPSPESLDTALSKSLMEHLLWSGEASSVLSFEADAHQAGVVAQIERRAHDAFRFACDTNIITSQDGSEFPFTKLQPIIEESIRRQVAIAQHGIKIAAITLLHNATERLLWRLVRFGIVANRHQVVEWVSDKKVSIKDILEHGVDGIVDRRIESWWEDLERDSIARKWDVLATLVGFPEGLTGDGNWHFDRQTLVEFDKVRQDAVHHSGRAVRSFDVCGFANQLSRCVLLWVGQVARRLGIRLRPEQLMAVKRDWGEV